MTADLFEPLSSPLAQLTEELWRWQGNRQLLVLGQFQSTNTSYVDYHSVYYAQWVELILARSLKYACNKLAELTPCKLLASLDCSLSISCSNCKWGKR